MSKSEILNLRKRYIDLGIVLTRVIRMPDGVIIEKKVNAAEELNLRDTTGRYDISMAEQAIELEKLRISRTLYDLTKALLTEMDKKELIWSKDTEELHWNIHRELFLYCEIQLLKMKVISRHDSQILATIESHDGVPIGAKIISEKEFEKGSGGNTEEYMDTIQPEKESVGRFQK